MTSIDSRIRWKSEPKEDEYSTAEVRDITGWKNPKIMKLSQTKAIIKTRTGFYTKESVDAYMKDRAERLAIAPPGWLVRGTQET